MRIFLSVQHLGSFLVYEPVIRELAARGHHIHLAVSRTEVSGMGEGPRCRACRSSADQLDPPVAISDDVGVLVRAGTDDSSVGRLPPVFRFQLRRGAEAALASRGTCASDAGEIEPRHVPRCATASTTAGRASHARARAARGVRDSAAAARVRTGYRADHAPRIPRVLAVRDLCAPRKPKAFERSSPSAAGTICRARRSFEMCLSVSWCGTRRRRTRPYVCTGCPPIG